MPGFDAVGTLPVGVIGAPPSGTNYGPAGAEFLFYAGSAPTTSAGTSPIRITGLYIEVLNSGPLSPVRVTGVYSEVLHSGPLSPVNITGVYVEVLYDPRVSRRPKMLFASM